MYHHKRTIMLTTPWAWVSVCITMRRRCTISDQISSQSPQLQPPNTTNNINSTILISLAIRVELQFKLEHMIITLWKERRLQVSALLSYIKNYACKFFT
jgi:hypothetical protein